MMRKFLKGFRLGSNADALANEGEVKYNDTTKEIQYKDDAGTKTIINSDSFTGAGVSTGVDGNGKAQITIAGGGGGSNNLIQTKILTANVTTNTTMSDITFSSLETNKFYRVCGQIHLEDSANDAFRVEIKENGNNIGRVYQDPASSGTISSIFGVNCVFKSTGTGSLTFVTVGVGATGHVVGNSTRLNTYITLEEIPNMEETTKWT